MISFMHDCCYIVVVAHKYCVLLYEHIQISIFFFHQNVALLLWKKLNIENRATEEKQ